MNRIVCVCTGNTCRSPMASALLQRELPLWEVSSAGLYAVEGAPASQNAVLAMREYGIDISAHSASPFHSEMTANALIVAMTRAHAGKILQLSPNAHVVCMLENSDVPDPFAGSLDSYRKTALMLKTGAKELVKRLNLR